VEVIDTGVGIAPEHRARVFEEFYQVGVHGPTAGRGMGLGLAIVRRFAALLDHEVTLSSRPGLGSRFSVLAPRVTDVRAHATRRALPGAPMRFGDEATNPLAGTAVMVIDDDPAAVEGLRALFDTWGATVAGGESAPLALAALGAGRGIGPREAVPGLDRLFARDTITILVTDSGLGGLAVAADLERGLRERRAFMRHTATIGVLTLDGGLVTRAVVDSEFRTANDLFDRVSGGAGPAGLKAVAPIGDEPIRVEIPEDVDAVSVLGEKLLAVGVDGTETIAAPGRPIAIISNVVVDYKPAPPPKKKPVTKKR
jgi:NAD(P)-dependent dehydrogenase (short-subunit alcohol dehydrogenase family)